MELIILYVFKYILEELLGKKFDFHGIKDSKTVFNVIANNGNTLEKMLRINIWSIRECFKHGELKSLRLNPSETNIADAFTKR